MHPNVNFTVEMEDDGDTPFERFSISREKNSKLGQGVYIESQLTLTGQKSSVLCVQGTEMPTDIQKIRSAEARKLPTVPRFSFLSPVMRQVKMSRIVATFNIETLFCTQKIRSFLPPGKGTDTRNPRGKKRGTFRYDRTQI